VWKKIKINFPKMVEYSFVTLKRFFHMNLSNLLKEKYMLTFSWSIFRNNLLNSNWKMNDEHNDKIENNYFLYTLL